VWCNHGPLLAGLRGHLAPGAVEVVARHEPLGWLDATGAIAMEAGPTGRVAVLCGIARPAGFLRCLRRLGLVPALRWIAPDHARWSAAELARFEREAGDLPIVTTEKDLVRLPEGFPARALAIETRMEAGSEAIEARLARLLVEHALGGRAP
ncbi:MAG: tetraacyldisaccharide 4'-kinase, partial [Pseudomonadota bacterium]